MLVLKLRSKVIFAFFLITCISTVSTTFFAIHFFSEKIRTEAIENMQRHLEVVYLVYQHQLSRVHDLAQFLANDASLQQHAFYKTAQPMLPILTNVAEREALHQLIVLDENAQAIAQVRKDLQGNISTTIHRAKKAAGQDDGTLNTPFQQLAQYTDFKAHTLVQTATKQRKTIAATEAVETEAGTLLTLTAVSPIFKRTLKREIAGYVLVRYLLNQNPDIIREMQRLFGGTAVIYHAGQAVTWQQSAETQPPSITADLYQTLIQSSSLSHESIDIREGGYLAQYRSLRGLDLKPLAVLGIRIPADRYVETTEQAIQTLLGIMFLCILGAFIIAYFLASSLLVPIDRLMKGVHLLESGDLSQKIQVKTRDELGILATAFNTMTQQLNEFFNVFRNTIDILTRAATALTAEKDLNRLLELIVSEVCMVCHADGGTLYTLENEQLTLKILQNSSLNLQQGGTSGESVKFTPVRLMAQDNGKYRMSVYAAKYKKLIYVTDVDNNQEFDFAATHAYDQALNYKTHAILVLPLLDRMNHTVGVLQLVNPLDEKTQQPIEFSKTQMAVLHSLASQAAVAIESARNYQKIAQKNTSFRRFMPTEFLSRLGHAEVEEIDLGDSSQEHMAVLFSDIRSFTTLSESLRPSDNFTFLNDYLRAIGPNITAHAGFIDKYIGDAIMALFPGDHISEADDAVAAAIGMQRSLARFNQHREQSNLPPLSIGIGIHAGPLILGTIGFETRIETTVIGDTVNLASRIEGLTKQYGITLGITSTTLEKVHQKEHLLVRELDTVQVKGKQQPITVYEIFNADPEALREIKQQHLEDHHSALHLYRNREWREALGLFQKIAQDLPEDRTLKRYLQRCRHFMLSPPDENWQGITRLDEK